MPKHRVFYWVIQNERRRRVLLALRQPMTAMQVARALDLNLDSALRMLWGLRLNGVVRCLNPSTQNNRLYFPTSVGQAFQGRIQGEASTGLSREELREIPWDLYASVCYRHRAAAIKAIRQPMQAAAIRRRAVLNDPKLRMSANNCRDVMRYLKAKDIVEKTRPKKRGHPRYQLSELGRTFQRLLMGAATTRR